MRAWAIVGVVVGTLVGIQLAGRAMRGPATAIGPSLVVEQSGLACPSGLRAAPAWTRSPAAYTSQSGPPAHGVTVRGVPHRRPLTYATWSEGGWLFQANNAGPNEIDPLWAAFRNRAPPGTGVVRATLSARGVVHTVSWWGAPCHSAILRATAAAVARWTLRCVRSGTAGRWRTPPRPTPRPSPHGEPADGGS